MNSEPCPNCGENHDDGSEPCEECGCDPCECMECDGCGGWAPASEMAIFRDGTHLCEDCDPGEEPEKEDDDGFNILPRP